MHPPLLFANSLIALCYYTIALLVGIQMWQGRARGLNPLALATAGIFLTCALGHSTHVLAYALDAHSAGASTGAEPLVVVTPRSLLTVSSLPQLAQFVCAYLPSAAAFSAGAHGDEPFTLLQLAVDIATVVPAAGFLALRRRYRMLVQGEAVILDYERRIATEQALVTERTRALDDAQAHAAALEAAHARTEQALAALREREAQLRLQAHALDAIGQAVLITTTGGVITYWNRAAEAMYGWTTAGAIGQRGSAMVAAHDSARAAQALETAPVRGVQTLALTMQCRDGTTFPSAMTVAPVTHGDDGLLGLVAVVTDLTEREQAEQARLELERAMQEAQRLESLGLLAGGIAHDFNNILTGVLGHAELAALDAPPGSTLHHALQQIVTGAQHAAGLTRQMLAYAGKGQFVLQPVSLTALVREIAELLQVSLGRNTTLRYRLADPLPLIEADIAQVQQVIMNLLTNAAEALGDAVGSITVTTAATTLTAEDLGMLPGQAGQLAGPYVLLEVADTGCGMAPEVLRRIFEPFYTTKFTGRGLGLAAVQGIVRSHEGLLDVSSHPGAGTRVRVWFPVSETPALSPTTASEPPVQECGTVMIIEDEATVRNVLARLVERLGYTPFLAADGATGLEALGRDLPMVRAVLVDVTMPGMNGVEVARAIRQTRPDVPVLLMSGYSADEVTMRYGELPALALLQKPCTLAALGAVLHSAAQREG